MLINHPTDGATHGLTLRVRLLVRQIKKKDNITIFYFFLGQLLFFFLPQNLLSRLLIRSNTVYIIYIYLSFNIACVQELNRLDGPTLIIIR